MAEYTSEALDKVIKEQRAKIDAQIYSLRLKCVQRERIEAEIVELKDSMQKAEDFIKLMQGIQDDKEDKAICEGIKLERKRKRGRGKPSKPK